MAITHLIIKLEHRSNILNTKNTLCYVKNIFRQKCLHWPQQFATFKNYLRKGNRMFMTSLMTSQHDEKFNLYSCPNQIFTHNSWMLSHIFTKIQPYLLFSSVHNYHHNEHLKFWQVRNLRLPFHFICWKVWHGRWYWSCVTSVKLNRTEEQ